MDSLFDPDTEPETDSESEESETEWAVEDLGYDSEDPEELKLEVNRADGEKDPKRNLKVIINSLKIRSKVDKTQSNTNELITTSL
jgi:hypothetical protein